MLTIPKLVERIKGVLAPLERRVGEKLFFFGQKWVQTLSKIDLADA